MKIAGLLQKYWVTILGVILGALGGFLYWYFVGCEDGTCAIKSSPWSMTLWGTLFGGALMNLIFSKKK